MPRHAMQSHAGKHRFGQAADAGARGRHSPQPVLSSRGKADAEQGKQLPQSGQLQRFWRGLRGMGAVPGRRVPDAGLM